MFNTVAAFAALMTKFNIPGNTDKTTSNTLYHNTDKHGRVFVNLPIAVDGSSDIMKDREFMADEGEDSTHATFIIRQRYVDSAIFSITGADDLDPMGPHALLGNDLDNFTKLEKLLSGETLRFYESGRAINDNDKYNRWIEISLRK